MLSFVCFLCCFFFNGPNRISNDDEEDNSNHGHHKNSFYFVLLMCQALSCVLSMASFIHHIYLAVLSLESQPTSWQREPDHIIEAFASHTLSKPKYVLCILVSFSMALGDS